jgi:uncharacterized protein DUF6152
LKGIFLILFSFGIAASIVSVPVAAHHGFANYETDKRVTLKATVTDWIWSNPHCVVQFDASDESGKVVHWVAETENPSSMIRYGWTKDSLKAGDQVTITVIPVKSGSPVGRIAEIAFPDGHKLLGRTGGATQAKPEESGKQ